MKSVSNDVKGCERGIIGIWNNGAVVWVVRKAKYCCSRTSNRLHLRRQNSSIQHVLQKGTAHLHCLACAKQLTSVQDLAVTHIFFAALLHQSTASSCCLLPQVRFEPWHAATTPHRLACSRGPPRCSVALVLFIHVVTCSVAIRWRLPSACCTPLSFRHPKDIFAP